MSSTGETATTEDSFEPPVLRDAAPARPGSSEGAVATSDPR